MSWQFNWRVWHWPWYNKTIVANLAGKRGSIYSHFAGIGPLQFHWYSSRKSHANS